MVEQIKKTRIAAMGDIHVGETSRGEFNELFEEISQKADALLLCGDLTRGGYMSEAEILANELLSCKIPVVAVLGNHDFQMGKQLEMTQFLTEKRVHILDGDSFAINNVGIAGIKGFGGGFGKYSLSAFGEEMMKSFVKETVDEALKLENALAQLKTDHKIAVLHYAPIMDTVMNESPEIYPFLGSSRLLEPLHRLEVSHAFHGHAHLGPHTGETSKGLKVFNVAYELMKQVQPKQPYVLIEL